jgi:hypothetical protein
MREDDTMSPTTTITTTTTDRRPTEAWVWRDASSEGVVAPGSARRR